MDTEYLGEDQLTRSIDIHAHITPEGFLRAAENGEDWYGTMADAGGMYNYNPKTAWSPEQRLADMDSLGVDVHVLSTNAYFYNYDKDAEAITNMSREANDYVSQLTKDHPTRFSGLANLPMQDVGASVAELGAGGHTAWTEGRDDRRPCEREDIR